MAKNIVSASKENSPVSSNKRKTQEVTVISKKPQPIPVANKDPQYKKQKHIKEPESESSSEEEEEEEDSSSEESSSEADSNSSASEQEDSDDACSDDSEDDSSDAASSSEQDSDADSDSSEEKVAKAPAKGTPAKPAKAVALKSKPESDSDSDASLEDDDDEDEDEDEDEGEDEDEDQDEDEDADSDASNDKVLAKGAKQPKGGATPSKENAKNTENKKAPVVALASNNRETPTHGSNEFTVFIGNLAYEVTEDHLNKEFSKCGKIASVRLVTDKATGRSKGIAYLDFTNKKDYESALAMKGQEMMGRALRIDAASSGREFANKPKSEPTPILFVGNLSYNTTEKSLESAFAKFGPIMSVRIPTSYDKKPKGYAYVQFKSVESAKAAMDQPRFELDGRAVRLDYDGNSGSNNFGQNRNNNRRNNY